MPNPALPGNTRHAYAIAQGAPTLPLTITAASNDQIAFNSLQYIIPAGVYSTIQQLADAVQASVADEDNVTTLLLSTVLLVDVSHSAPTKLRFTSTIAGVNVQTLTTGAENSGLVAIGVTSGLALAAGDPVD